MTERTVAALFVYVDGPYASEPDVELWDEAKDARLYPGPHPVVAHPPCARWGAMRHLVRAVHGYQPGDDGGCFAAALASVRRWGGVLEHPAFSDAWRVFDLPRPGYRGWVRGICGGWSCYVEQHAYGHASRKPTWLYACGVEPPEIRWQRTHTSRVQVGASYQLSKAVLDRAKALRADGKHDDARRMTSEERQKYKERMRSKGFSPRKMAYRESSESPAEFRALLLSMARSSSVEGAR